MFTCTIPNFTIYQPTTNFTHDQLLDYADRYSRFDCLNTFMDTFVCHTWYITGFIGLFSQALMLACLCRSTELKGPTLIYLKAITVFEFPHMLVMIEGGFLRIYADDLQSTYWFNVWKQNCFYGWHIGDWSKLSISTLTALLTFERFVAVRFPIKFKSIDRKSIAYGAVAMSIFLGSAHVWAHFVDEVYYDPWNKVYWSRKTTFGWSGWYHFTQQFIYVWKILMVAVILVLSIAIIFALRRQARLIAAMTSSTNPEWRSARLSSYFTLIISLCLSFDHLVWVIYKINDALSLEIDPRKTITSADKSYDTAIADMDYRQVVLILGYVQAWTGEIVHGWRFWIHYAFSKSTRLTLRRLVKKNDVSEGEVRLRMPREAFG